LNKFLDSFKSIKHVNNKVILNFLILCGTLLSYYPYFFRENLVGVDTKWYYNRLNELNSRKDLIKFFLSEPHSLYLIVLFLVQKLTNLSSLFIIKASPALLTTFLIITVYSLVKTGTKNEYLGTLSSAFACFSYYTTVGMFSGIFAN
ncbi:MAG: hypothetical protein QW723_02485, partial [Candidatus Bathyarchaeia archaeon]